MVTSMPGTQEMRQQLDAQDARSALEKYLSRLGQRLLDWQSEREIRSEALSLRALIIKERGYELTQEELAGLPELPDARATIEPAPGDETYRVDIEIDGAYYNRMLKRKINGFLDNHCQTGRSLVWVTTTRRRAKRIRQEIEIAGARHCIAVMVLEDELNLK